MKNTNSTDFAQLVTEFLTDYLPLQRSYSKNTIYSYRDTLKIFIRFVSDEKGIDLCKFTLKDFNRSLIIEFLEWYRGRGVGNTTANQRLAAIKSFCDFAQLEGIEYMAPLQDVISIKSKKAKSKEISFLTIEQMSNLVNKPDINTVSGLRHRTALTLMYDSGCRVQELCDLTVGDICVGTNPTVRLHGKGDKHRTVVVSTATANLMESYINRCRKNALRDHPLITNRYNQKLDRDGVSYMVQKYTNEIRKEDHTFPEKMHCHMFRHSKGMHMLAAGVNIVYIRDFLGHEDISVTMVYAKADNRLKNEAINKLAPKVIGSTDYPDWSKDHDLMDFLNSLK